MLVSQTNRPSCIYIRHSAILYTGAVLQWMHDMSKLCLNKSYFRIGSGSPTNEVFLASFEPNKQNEELSHVSHVNNNANSRRVVMRWCYEKRIRETMNPPLTSKRDKNCWWKQLSYCIEYTESSFFFATLSVRGPLKSLYGNNFLDTFIVFWNA